MRCLALTMLLVSSLSSLSIAQRPPNATRPLDVQADKLQMEYLKGLADLASGYEKVGDIEKSTAMLKEILKIKPDVDSVKKKLEEFEEMVFDKVNQVIEVDTSSGWTNTGIVVFKDKPVRLEAIGSYKFIVNETLGPEGFDDDQAAKDLVSGVPAGALIAVVTPPQKGRNNRNQGDAKPFEIGKGREVKPKEGGLLLLKVNAPPQAKCIGKIKVKISGNIAPAR